MRKKGHLFKTSYSRKARNIIHRRQRREDREASEELV